MRTGTASGRVDTSAVSFGEVPFTGSEVEATWLVIPELTVSTSAGYTHARIASVDAYRGLGPRIIRNFLRREVFVVPSTNLCLIDPAQNNFAAIRAYKKVGFHHIGTIQMPGELQPSYLMIIRRDEQTCE